MVLGTLEAEIMVGARKARRSARPARGSKAAVQRVVQRDIESWSEFVDIVQGWKGFRNWCFRGQNDARWY